MGGVAGQGRFGGGADFISGDPGEDALLEKDQRLGGPGLGGDGLRGQGHQSEQCDGIRFGADPSPARQGDHDRNDFAPVERRRIALVELVAQHVGVHADGPG